MTEALLTGALLGFAIAAPIGPTGILCIQRTLSGGFSRGLATGLGAATADAAYGAVAAFGLAAVSGFLTGYVVPIRIAGAGFILYLAARMFFARPLPPAAADTNVRSLLQSYLSATILTLANPATIVSFIAIFAGLGLAGESGVADAAATVLGVFLGSGAWWILLSVVTARVRHDLDERGMRWVNRVSGISMVLLALYALFSGRS